MLEEIKQFIENKYNPFEVKHPAFNRGFNCALNQILDFIETLEKKHDRQ